MSQLMPVSPHALCCNHQEMATFRLICSPQRKYKQNIPHVPSIHYPNLQAQDIVYKISPDLLPLDMPVGLQPIWIYGNGSCFFHMANHLLYGNERYYQEMWVRVVIEAIRKSKLYLSNDYLRWGLPSWFFHVHLTGSYCSYSEQYWQGMDEWNKDTVSAVYEDEIYALRLNSTWAGIW